MVSISGMSEASAQEEKIFVAVRLRPMNEKEIAKNEVCDWECIEDNTIVYKNNPPTERLTYPNAYTFDQVYNWDTTTKQVYEGVKGVALSALQGINSSIFAYGQTSSGKTYTMSGLTQFAFADIFEHISKQHDREFVLKFSAIEIYNECVRDLLSADSTPLRLLDDPEKGTVVDKLTEVYLEDWGHLMELLAVCEAQRQIGETALNGMSSRSHQIIRLTIESSPTEYSGIENASTLTATVNFVDLAGSERASQTQTAGTRLKEGCHINRSLLTLGTVIRKLSKGRSGHVPYRDSKLTRILQNSLGGNARTAIICTLSPARGHLEQSRNTLLFAVCAKEVRTSAQVNVVMSDKALVKQLQREMARLENELRAMSETNNSNPVIKEKDRRIQKMEREIKKLTHERDVAQYHLEEVLQAAGIDRNSLPWTDSSHLRNSTWGGHSESDTSLVVDDPLRSNGPPDKPQLQIPDDDHYFFDNINPNEHMNQYLAPWEKAAQRTGTDSQWEKTVQRTGTDAPGEKAAHRTGTDSPGGRAAQRTGTDSPSEKAAQRTGTDPPREKTAIRTGTDSPWEKTPQKTGTDSLDSHKEVQNIKKDEIDDTQDQEQDSIYESSPHSSITDVSYSTTPSFRRSRSGKEEAQNSKKDQIDDTHDSEQDSNYMASPRSSVTDVSYSTTPSFKSRSGREVTRGDSSPVSEKNEKAEDDEFEENVTGKTITESRSEGNIDRFEGDLSKKNIPVTRSEGAIKKLCRQDSQKSATGVDEKETQRTEGDIYVYSPTKTLEKVMKYDRRIKYGDCMVETTPKAMESGDASLKFDEEWPLIFEKQRKKIIELWDECNIPLLHRTYFFLLIKGDPSDCVYVEVELRRLCFLKLTVDLLASARALNLERAMLSRKLLKKFSAAERDALFEKWGIDLESKNRRVQLSQLLWKNTDDMEHIRESAELVAKLVGLIEPHKTPKELFALSFAPQNENRLSGWKFSIPLLNY